MMNSQPRIDPMLMLAYKRMRGTNLQATNSYLIHITQGSFRGISLFGSNVTFSQRNTALEREARMRWGARAPSSVGLHPDQPQCYADGDGAHFRHCVIHENQLVQTCLYLSRPIATGDHERDISLDDISLSELRGSMGAQTVTEGRQVPSGQRYVYLLVDHYVSIILESSC